MRSRSKLFLTFAFLITVPLLLITLIALLISLRLENNSIQSHLEQEFQRTKESFDSSLRARDRELIGLKNTVTAFASSRVSSNKPGPSNTAKPTNTVAEEHVIELKEVLSNLFAAQRSYLSIASFGPDKEIMFIARPSQGDGPIVFRDKEFNQSDNRPDERVWTAAENEILCDITTQNVAGTMRRCSILLPAHAGALLSIVSVDTLLTDVARPVETFGSNGVTAANITVLDNQGNIVYDTNSALKHQKLNSAAPDFVSVARQMTNHLAGTQLYQSTTGDQWRAVYGPLPSVVTNSDAQDLSLAVSSDVTALTRDFKRFELPTALLAVLLGLSTATLLTWFFERQARRLERVTQSVTAIAGGKLDMRVDAHSSDDIRPLADGVNLMTARLREQLARDAETRQVQSFVRLSAMLTHDLKNAIGGLSLLVTNMEKHFDDAEFRADAMRSLTGATQKLRTLVERLSNPVATLSGEFRRPTAVDIVLLLKRVVAETVEHKLGDNRLEFNLPTTLVAKVDEERMEKVIENLILNALQAMTNRPGTLTVSAGPEDAHFIFVEISDSGVGMSPRFIQERLFHAFSTTKKSGMGLGLYTSREVVDAVGGRIEVTSSEDVGTTFRLVLPSPPSD